MKKIGKVWLDGAAYQVHDVRENPARYSKVLKLAHAARKHASCHCNADLRIKLCFLAGLPYFALWPKEGKRHHQDCLFHRDEIDAALGAAAARAAIVEDEDGVVKIAPAFPLARKLKPATKRIAPTGSPAQVIQQRRAKLLNILRFLWERADLARWASGWTRDYYMVHRCITSAAQDCVVGKQGLLELLYMPPPYKERERKKINEERTAFLLSLELALDALEVRSGLVLGQIKAVDQERGGFVIRLSQSQMCISVSDEQGALLATRYPREDAALRSGADDCGCMVIAQVELEEGNRLVLVDGALMLVSKQYIPADSSYEVAAANALVKEGRTFRKPLQVEPGEELLPDFLLTDTSPRTVMEVFGMDTPEYLDRKAQKLRMYQERGERLWAWEAVGREQMPAFPPQMS